MRFRPSLFSSARLGDDRKPLHPLLLKIRSKIEWYAEYLEKGDPQEEQENLPMIYEGPVQEMEGLGKAVSETRSEEQYLEERWETVISQIERSRIAYFDSLFGTNTYFHEIDQYQERVAIDTILERSGRKYKKGRRLNLLADLLISQTNRRQLERLLKFREDKESVQRMNFRDKLYMYPTRVHDPAGRVHSDPYLYVNPEFARDKDHGIIVNYIDQESRRFWLNLNHGDTVYKRMVEDLVSSSGTMQTEEALPLLTKTHAYCMSRLGNSFFRVPISQFPAAGFSMKEDMLDLVDATSRIIDMPEPSREALEELAWDLSKADPMYKVGDSPAFEVMFTLDELKEFFFNFRDTMSFAVCRYFKTESIKSHDIIQRKFDQGGRFMIVTLYVNNRTITVVFDTKTRKFLNRYFMGDLMYGLASTILEDPKTNTHYLYMYMKPEIGTQKIQPVVSAKGDTERFFTEDKPSLVRYPIREDDLISHQARADTIQSVRRYMIDHEDTLIDNKDCALLEVLLRNQKSAIEKWSLPREVGGFLYIDYTGPIDGVIGQGSLRVLHDGTLQRDTNVPLGSIYGETKSWCWAVNIGAMGKEPKLWRRLKSNSLSPWKELVVKALGIKDVHFADDYIAFVFYLNGREREDVYCSL